MSVDTYYKNLMQKPIQIHSTFVYSPNRPYIRLIKLLQPSEESDKNQLQYNLFLLPRKYSTQSCPIGSEFMQSNNLEQLNDQNIDQISLCKGCSIQRCQLIDCRLNMMIQYANFRDLQKDSYCLQYQDNLDQQQLLQKTCNQLELTYLSFPKNPDFQIGRKGYVRTWKSMPIDRRSISRNHCKIIMNSNTHRQGQILKICSNKSRRNCLLRKIPAQILNKIQEYLYKIGNFEYKIIDQHSTFGTYIHQIPSFINRKAVNFAVKLYQNGSYSFNVSFEYFIKVEKIIETKDFENNQKGVQQIKAWVKKQYQSKKVQYIFVPKQFIPQSYQNLKSNNQQQSNTHFSFIKIRIQVFKKETYQHQKAMRYIQDQKIILIGTSSQQPYQSLFLIGKNLLELQNHINQSIQQDLEQQLSDQKIIFIGQNDGINKLQINLRGQRFLSTQADSEFRQSIPERIGLLAFSGKSWFLCNDQKQLKYISGSSNTFKVQKSYPKSFPIKYKNNGINRQPFCYIPPEFQQVKIWTKVPSTGIILKNDRKYKVRLGTPQSGCVYLLLEFIDFDYDQTRNCIQV